MLKELLNSWFGDNKVKIRSPVVGAFMGSWIIFNWKHFLLLFWGSGALEVRLINFDKILHVANLSLWLWPLCFAIFYAFCLPYLNVLSQMILSKAEEWRHQKVIDLDIVKAKQKGLLNEEIYKSDPLNTYLSDKIAADLKKLEAEAERVKAEADKSEAQLADAKAVKEKSEAEAEQEAIRLKEAQRKDEKESQTHENAKAVHQHRLGCLRFPLVYQYIKTMSDILAIDDKVARLDTLTSSIASIFGYTSTEELLHDDNFTLESIERLSFVYYQAQQLLEDLRMIAELDMNEGIDEETLFDCLIMTFEKLDQCKLFTDDSVGEEASIFVNEYSYDLMNSNAVSSAMAETNAYFDEVYVEMPERLDFDMESGTLECHFDGTISGRNHEDKPFSGDTLDVSFILSYSAILGKHGLAQPEFGEIRAAISHPDNHSYK